MEAQKTFKHKSAISASRMDKLNDCSMLYAARYVYKLPDKGNSGASRGSVSHDIFEVLAKNSRHKKIVDEVIANKTCVNSAGLWSLIGKYAKKYNVYDTDNLDLIDSFIYVGLKNQFYGPKGTVEILTEKDFDFEVCERNVSYRLKGFIDKIFIIQEGNTLYCEVRDFKSSKIKFTGEKITQNNQALIYQLAVRHLLPEATMRRFEFLFLKFPREPVQEIKLYDKAELYGYEMYLTEIQKSIDDFGMENQSDNFAALNPGKSWLCGKEGFKKDGSPNFICNSRKPFDYYVIRRNGEIFSSAFTAAELKPKEGEKVEKVNYPGCRYYYNKGKKRNHSI